MIKKCRKKTNNDKNHDKTAQVELLNRIQLVSIYHNPVYHKSCTYLDLYIVQIPCTCDHKKRAILVCERDNTDTEMEKKKIEKGIK